MRIDTIETFVAGHWLFVAVTTDTGVTGVGESTYFTHPLAARAVLDDLEADLIGADAFRPEFHFNRLFKHHCLRDSALMGALSAIDQALWDIKGKALGVPVYELLGGRVRDKVRAILLIEATSEDEMIRKAVEARAEGFTAIKIKPFLGDWATRTTVGLLGGVVASVGRVREAIGWDMDMAVEIHRNLTPDLAEVFAADVRPLRPYFLEDPILPFSLESNGHAAARMGGVVALAERNTNIWEFREFSDRHAVSILRPDVGLAGGFTQVRKIAAIAESRHQRIVPHNFTSPVVTACHIQLAACTTNWDVQGYVREAREPWNRVVKQINRLEEGFLAIPDTPGIGVELDVDYLRQATYEPFGNKFAHGAARAMDGAVRHQ
ncbi:MAG: mandelate racemase/muconate lactonizing enzyme family protein [Phenylobacterium sp.]|uniref:mandelate racemase/muconate lactonizing enzyme family protein n=1 Tax=Phenylobacterium sp. TaxID=1871053 RepID=UPI001A4505E5|nr:mandelate racemase/muconate lactonizing enzyme family protein [Phenylobacterium sp.]MBL8553987.1 mandelate racemase/muconate lactonizing enzyme family protein [Phenylobacterium sp.]